MVAADGIVKGTTFSELFVFAPRLTAPFTNVTSTKRRSTDNSFCEKNKHERDILQLPF